MGFTLRLEFYGATPQLSLVSLRQASGGERVSVRGKTPGAWIGKGTFQWTAAVRALALLLVKWSYARALKGDGVEWVVIAGEKGSLAASLDYALYKNPLWVFEMFGADHKGAPFLRRFIVRTNPGRKRAGPVIVGINPRLVAGGEIEIFWDDGSVLSLERLRHLLTALEKPGVVTTA